MSDEMKVQTKGFNKKFLVIAIALIVVGLVAALVLLLPTSAKAKKVEEQLNLGAKYLSELDYEQAIVAYEAVIKIDPKCEEAYLALADVYITMGDFNMAEEVLKQAEEVLGVDATASIEAKKQEVLTKRTLTEKKPEPTPTDIPTPTEVPTGTPTPVMEPSNTPTPTVAPDPTEVPVATSTPIPDPTSTPTPSPAPTSVPVLTDEDLAQLFVYSIADGKVTINGIKDATITEARIPEKIEGYPVTAIGDRAFDMSNLVSLEAPDSITNIGFQAFNNCTKLKHFVLPAGLTTIGDWAFYGCESLEEIKIPSGVTYLGEYVFGLRSDTLRSITIPSSVVSIADYAFFSCEGLEEIEIPSSVTSLGSAFADCSGLKRVVLPSGLTTIGNVFARCSSLESVALPANLTSIPASLFYGCSNLKSVTIPSGVTTVGGQAFYGCSSLESITIPSGVTHIGYQAFYDCTSLKEVSIPDSVTDIDRTSFLNTPWYAEKTANEEYMQFGDYLWWVSPEKTGSFQLPHNVTKINIYAFAGCNKLTSISISSPISSLPYGVFDECSGLSSIIVTHDTVATLLEFMGYGSLVVRE